MDDRPAIRPWTQAELRRLERTQLIRVAGTRADGTLSGFVTIGHVRLGDDVLIRSLKGPDGLWYRRAVASGSGEMEVDGERTRVAFIRDAGRDDDVDRAFRTRYGNDDGVRAMVSSPARETTLKAVPLG